jgi:hypothetical protein
VVNLYGDFDVKNKNERETLVRDQTRIVEASTPPLYEPYKDRKDERNI